MDGEPLPATGPVAAAPPAESIWAQRKPPRWLGRAVFTAAIVVVAVLLAVDLLSRLRSLLILLVVSFFIACAMEPGVNALARRGWRRSRAAGLIFLLVGAVMAGFVVLMGRLLVDQVRDLVDALPGFAREAARLIDDRFNTDLSSSDVISRLTGPDGPLPSLGKQIAGDVVGIGASVIGLLFQLLSLVLFTYYFVVDGPRLRHWLCTFLPPHRQRELMRLSDIAVDRTAAYFYYRIALAVISAAVHTSAFLAIGLPNAVALGIWVGLISQFIPTVGTYVAGILPLLVAVGDGLRTVLIVLVFIVVYQQIENYVVSPRLSLRTMNIHPAVGFGSVIAGTAILGPVGALLALPFVAIVQAFAGTYIRRHEVVDPLTGEQGMPSAPDR
jgi:predicted PurR-regulated permease PerM